MDVLIDGEGGALSPHDRGLHYGDGLFETMAVKEGGIPLWQRHMERLARGCRRLGITMPDEGLLREDAEALSQGMAKGVLKLILTRGEGRGYRPLRSSAKRILLRYPWPSYPPRFAREGVVVRLCRIRLACQPFLAGIKHLNRLEQVLARMEWDDPDIPEGLMLDQEGRVIEGTQSNLFIAKGGRLVTPDLSRCGVEGVMRGEVMARARDLGIPVEVKDVTLKTLEEADEAFLCNSLIGLWPVRRIGKTPYPRGPFTVLLQEHLGWT